MKFSPKPKHEQPPLGHRRTVKKFAWFPIHTDDGFWVWLEQYEEVSEYQEFIQYVIIYPGSGPLDNAVRDWRVVKRNACFQTTLRD